ncbi:hypothetical protein QJS04_geneDACA020064 [Acorus gramineus]|uniref:Uncharacterized protein n=1 Tax=Acorus gramineus TaxID=55184 RepID=A0AAV9A6I2_ACOGR|nr:hypothetical protein QJS04_geneDACA020064 [Acorus gramineus]
MRHNFGIVICDAESVLKVIKGGNQGLPQVQDFVVQTRLLGSQMDLISYHKVSCKGV